MNNAFIPIFTLLAFSFLGSLMNEAHAQVDKKHDKQFISVEWEEALLTMLDEQLVQTSKTPLHFYFLEKIEAHCQEDLDCQWDSYWVVMDELNALKLHLQCIPTYGEADRAGKSTQG
jgi:hypothetical protein